MFRKIIKKIKAVENNDSLSKEELFDMQKKLQVFQKQNPLPKRNFKINILTLNYKFMIPAIIALAVALSGGVGLAAQNTNPGDVLYPVKTSINEPLQSALTIDPEKKAEYQALLIERRLEEKAKLAEEKKLDKNLNEKLDANLQKRVEKTEDLVAKLKEKGNLNAATNVYNRLLGYFKANEEVLNKAIELKPEMKAVLESRLAEFKNKQSAVEEKLAEVEKEREAKKEENAQQKEDRLVEAEKAATEHLQKLEAEIADFEKKITDAAAKNLPVLTETKSKLDEAKSLLAEAKVNFTNKDFVKTIHLTNEAKQILVEVKVFLNTKVFNEPKFKNEDEMNKKIQERMLEREKKQAENLKEREAKRLENQKEKQAKIEEQKLEKKNEVEDVKTESETEESN